MEIFYRCDLNGNGYLSRDEFNEFQMRSSGEGCDDEAWDVVKGISPYNIIYVTATATLI